MFPQRLAVPHIFVGEFLGRRQPERLLVFDRLASFHCLAHLDHRVDRINGGGPRGFQGLENGFDLALELPQVAPAEGARALGQTVGGGGADCACAAHYHVLDRPGGLAEIRGGNDFELVRQEPLLDKQHRIARAVKRDGAEVARPAMEGDLQATLTFILRIWLWILR